MPTYQTIAQGEKSALLGDRPLIIERYTNGPHCACDVEGGRRRRRTGCCARLCRLFLWTCVGVVGLLFFLRSTHGQLQLPNFWGMGSPGEVPVTVTQCPSAPISYKPGQLSYSFDVNANDIPNGFFFSQHWNPKPIAAPSAQFIQTAGVVIVQAAPAGAQPVTVDLEVKLSHDELADVIHIKQEPAGLNFETENFLNGFTGAMPCISVIATISVAPSANVSFFDINTVVLPVELRKSLQLISNNIFIHSTAGSISSKSSDLDSRKIEVETTSGSISGSYPLAELLSVNSVSGNVDIDVKPEDVSPEQYHGTLLIRTRSGNIKANTLTTAIPNRNFTTQVHTVSGTVSGTYLLGVDSNLNSVSGTINTDFHTAGDLANRSLVVNSVSGSIQSRVHDDAFKLGTVRSSFHSQTGTVDTRFPAAWAGNIQGSSRTGSVDITGEGVKIIKDVQPILGFGRFVSAEKGDGFSNLSVETFSGSVVVRFP